MQPEIQADSEKQSHPDFFRILEMSKSGKHKCTNFHQCLTLSLHFGFNQFLFLPDFMQSPCLISAPILLCLSSSSIVHLPACRMPFLIELLYHQLTKIFILSLSERLQRLGGESAQVPHSTKHKTMHPVNKQQVLVE